MAMTTDFDDRVAPVRRAVLALVDRHLAPSSDAEAQRMAPAARAVAAAGDPADFVLRARAMVLGLSGRGFAYSHHAPEVEDFARAVRAALAAPLQQLSNDGVFTQAARSRVVRRVRVAGHEVARLEGRGLAVDGARYLNGTVREIEPLVAAPPYMVVVTGAATVVVLDLEAYTRAVASTIHHSVAPRSVLEACRLAGDALECPASRPGERRHELYTVRRSLAESTRQPAGYRRAADDLAWRPLDAHWRA
jgi:hypothetical protein